MPEPIHIGFVCQAGRLESQSCLLAASLRKHLGNRVPLIAGVGRKRRDCDDPSARTIRFLEDLGVSLEPNLNPIGDEYAIGNKLACLSVLENREGSALFLDSDMLVLADFIGIFESGSDFAAKPADLPTSGMDDETWIELLRHHGVEAPRSRFVTTHAMKAGIPYFNAGFIGLSNRSRLSACWIDHARQLAHDRDRHDYHLDQISLTIAVLAQGLQVRPIGEYLNFPAHLRPVPAAEPVRIAHYHHPARIAGNTRIRSEISGLCTNHPGLEDILFRDPEWQWSKPFAKRKRMWGFGAIKRAAPAPDFVITGIPRSGTSLFSASLEHLHEVIVINEPAEIFNALQRPGRYRLASYYQELRGVILSGQAVLNKVDKHDRLVEDTLVSDVRRSITYRPAAADFPLGTKNTLAYLSRIEQISESMPDCSIFCCVRNPISTIGSWRRSFTHLRNADSGHEEIGTPADPFLPEFEREQLREIAAQTDGPIKRALWWTFLATRILKNSDRITLIRYGDFVSSPPDQLYQAGLKLGLAKRDLRKSIRSMKKMKAVDRSPEISEFEVECIRGICATVASRLGYEL